MKWLRWLVPVALVAVIPALAHAQERGTVIGRVVSQSTNAGVPSATVRVQGAALQGVTDAQGYYRINGVPAGTYTLTASFIGLETANRQVTVVAGGPPAEVNFALGQAIISLEGLVATATGQQQRQREIGSSVGVVDVAEVELAAVSSFSELIQGRVAGAVVLQSSGTTGTGSRVRIRGNNSISLSNSPLLIIDGVRVTSDASSLGFGVGGQQPSRLNDLNPEDIQSIEILKGPAASALYGTAAANGVIQVTTKRGRAGVNQIRAWAEYGTINQVTDFPENVYFTGNLINNTVGRCDIIRRASGLCTAVVNEYRFNPLENSETTPFQDGNNRVLGGSISGGSDVATYYVSGEYSDEEGVLPQNQARSVRVQSNLTGNISDRLTISGNLSYLESDLELPLSDNALFGILGLGLYGYPLPSFVENNQGFRSNPAFFYDWKTFQDISRFTGSVRADYRPLTWLRLNGTVGLDRLVMDEVNRLPRETAYNVYGGVYSAGFIQNQQSNAYDLTTNFSGTGTFSLTPDVVSTTSVGTQYIREDYNEVYAFGATLTPGIETTLGGTTTDFAVDEATVVNATFATYLQQQFAWRDRVFVNAAVRGDKNTAFGTDIGWIWYPSFSGSWVVSEEPFFPRTDALSTLRLRAAWGQAGLRPGATDALQSFSSTIGTFLNEDQPAIVINELGNPDLEPERSTEWEVGFESGFFDGRLGLEATYFNKTSRDALVNVDLPPSLGGSANRFENLGRVDNSGLELLLNAEAVRRDNFSWNVRLTGSFVENELVDLGTNAQGEPIQPLVFGLVSAQRHAEGLPLGSFFQPEILGFSDANNDGLLSPAEVTIADTASFVGNPFPTREFSFSTDVSLWDWFRVSALADYKGGHEQLNFTRAFRCEDYVCAEVFDPSTPLDRQAAIVAWNSYGSLAGFVEDAAFVKLREVAVVLSAPRSLADRFGSGGLSLTLAGRNLATWTDYSGFDPEVNFAGQSNFNSGDAATLPPNRHFMIRIDANL